ncbi:MAG: class I SAM-dependent methyltransferase [bacterium]|nr:class I SAM-dependent methyltransferase [bacterium]
MRKPSPWNPGIALIASLAFIGPSAAAAQPGLQEICRDFQTWHETHDSPERATAAYFAELISGGVAREEAERRLALLGGSGSECPAAAAAAFDRIYGDSTVRFSTEPNALLVETVTGMKPGRALDVAMGQGRNSVFLASTGWEVTGFDVSAEGLSIARAAAASAKVEIRTVQQGWQEFDLGKQQWDLIVLSYAWVPIDDPAYVERLCDALRPGGTLVFEHMLGESRDELGIPETQQLLRAFASLRIVRYEEIEQRGDWHNEVLPLVRLVARK